MHEEIPETLRVKQRFPNSERNELSMMTPTKKKNVRKRRVLLLKALTKANVESSAMLFVLENYGHFHAANWKQAL